jgi:sugar lactone lactonase YvrE
MRNLLFLTAALLCLGATPEDLGESDLQAFNRLRQAAAGSLAAGDLPGAEQKLEAALALYPRSPGALLRLARTEALAGKAQEAIAHLSDYADLGLTWDLAGDAAFGKLSDHPGFAPLRARIEDNGRPIGAASLSALLAPSEGVIEGLAWDGSAWLVSGVTSRTLYRLGPKGLEPLTRPDAETGALFGIAADPAAGLVWAAEAWGVQVPGSSGPTRTGIVAFSLKTGQVLARHPTPDDGVARQLGDVALSPAGVLYATDSRGAALYRLPTMGGALQKVAQFDDLVSPQGMAFCSEERMILADYSTGLHVIDLRTGRSDRLEGVKAALAGVDGLGALNQQPDGALSLALTQNGVSPERILKVRIDASCRRLEAVTVMAAGPDLQDMTLLAGRNDRLFVISASGWSLDTEAPPRDRPSPRLMSLSLSGDPP